MQTQSSVPSGILPSGTVPSGTVLGVWAHPDDEAYLSAGLMAAARAAGRRVVVATATRGEHGTSDPVAWPPQRLARVRERELAASLAAVGVEEHHWLGHSDGELGTVDPGAGAAQISALLDRVRPDLVVTFGPDGMTGHSDHQAVSRWVTDACLAASRRPRLWHATLTPEFHEAWGRMNDAVGMWMDRTVVPTTPRDELVAQVHCDGELGERKHAALSAHTSQTGALIAEFGEPLFRAWWSREYFVDAFRSATRERSLVA